MMPNPTRIAAPRAPSALAGDPAPADAVRGLWLGLLGVALFALTLPMTRLAVGDASAPQLPPAFVTAGRAAVAGLLSALWLFWPMRPLSGRVPHPRWPPRTLWPALLLCAAGTVLGFPLGIALALREVESTHAAVITGLLPLATAAVAALALRQRPSAGFWACALAGAALVAGYALQRGGGRFVVADAWLLMAMLSAAVGYVAGARASAVLGAERAICWVLVIALPFTLPVALATRPLPAAAIGATAWAGFAYVAIVSMWLGFFAWYRALALGGVIRVSQVQLIQPFLSLAFAVPLLGERLDATTLAFALAVIAVVFIGRKMPVRSIPGAQARS